MSQAQIIIKHKRQPLTTTVSTISVWPIFKSVTACPQSLAEALFQEKCLVYADNNNGNSDKDDDSYQHGITL